MTASRSLAVSLFFTFISTGVAFSVRQQAPAAQTAGRPIALVGGTLVDGFGSTPIRNSVVLVEGERIKAVGPAGSLAVPSGYDVISTEGMTVLPGLWDMHVHLMITGHSDYTHWDKTYPARFENEIMPASARQLGADYAVPLSDHADFDDLIEAVRLVGAEEIYCTHGPASFAGCLRDLGYNAFRLEERACGAAAAQRLLPFSRS